MTQTEAPQVDTLLFVDVDGVLNISIRDGDETPVTLSVANMELAKRRIAQGCACMLSKRISEVTATAAEHSDNAQENVETYNAFVSTDGDLCCAFIGRLAQLIQAAGPCCRVVLSSMWRQPKHVLKRQHLESCISLHMGKSFKFDDCTGLDEDGGPLGRLDCIGGYIKSFCANSGLLSSNLRILVLDDFFAIRWPGVSHVDFTAAAERYLLAQAGDVSCSMVLRVVNTSRFWMSSEGDYELQVGCGLISDNVRQASDFLEGHGLSSAPKRGEAPWGDSLKGHGLPIASLSAKPSCGDERAEGTATKFRRQCSETSNRSKTSKRSWSRGTSVRQGIRLAGRMPVLVSRYLRSAQGCSSMDVTI